jgi:hypothetical protein
VPEESDSDEEPTVGSEALDSVMSARGARLRRAATAAAASTPTTSPRDTAAEGQGQGSRRRVLATADPGLVSVASRRQARRERGSGADGVV